MPRFTFRSDGLATQHYSPFLDDADFGHNWDRVSALWTGEPIDIRWRVWLLTRFARQASRLPGSFAEFGVYRGGCAYMVLACAGLPAGHRFFLLDTFTGIPPAQLSEHERKQEYAQAWRDASAGDVRRLLAPWLPMVEIVEGDVLETLAGTETGPIAFCHLDLNASLPTRHALEYIYPRLVDGGVLVLDDYGWAGYEEQRAALDGFFAAKPEELIALPTGQAFVLKD